MKRATLALALACCAAGCSRPAETPPTDAPPRRIAALQCAAVDVITLLGELDRVVAVEEDCPAPGTERKVKIRNEDHPGKLAAFNVEALLALHPDGVIAKPDLQQALDGRGLRVLWTPSYVDLENLPGFVEDVGRFVGAPDRARAALERMRAKQREIAARTTTLQRVRVYYETTGLGWTVGSRSVMHAMIELAGGENVAGGIAKPNVTLTNEAVLAADPEVIVLGPFADTEEQVRARPGWSGLAAVRAGRIHRISADRRYVTLGTPRCVDGCEEMLLPWLHPEAGASAEGR